MFAKHHYLSHTLNKSGNVYIAYVNGKLAGFLSVRHFPHPKVKNMKKIHRLVVLPDYQGIGIGVRLLEFIGKKYLKENYQYTITTSAPSLVSYFKLSPNWILSHFGRNIVPRSTKAIIHRKGNTNSISENRITTSWRYKL